MKNKSARLTNLRLGSIMLITAGAAFFVIAMTALVTDVGYLYFNQARLQTAVNAGWKAGYDRMIEKSQQQSPPTEAVQLEVRSHILEVMKSNGYSDAELATVQVEFGPKNHLKVSSVQKVGLFFARIMDFTYSNVAASRQNNALDLGQGVVPLAIPHGVIKDMSRSSYGGEIFGGTDGFKPGSAYILKLGSGGGPGDKITPTELGEMAGLSENEPKRFIYIPMRFGQAQPLKA
ncbi:MAG: pilus assembly protein TadG-related protein, partial [Candidatus Riflebacteria bacterium]|nr:pilus assembly protein TadG-related protein [Candidatus Riflebacteria bacterium]